MDHRHCFFCPVYHSSCLLFTGYFETTLLYRQQLPTHSHKAPTDAQNCCLGRQRTAPDGSGTSSANTTRTTLPFVPCRRCCCSAGILPERLSPFRQKHKRSTAAIATMSPVLPRPHLQQIIVLFNTTPPLFSLCVARAIDLSRAMHRTSTPNERNKQTKNRSGFDTRHTPAIL